MAAARVLFYVQHLLGIGHFRRAVTLVDAMSLRGLHVTMATGGFPIPGMAPKHANVVQLPPAGVSDLSFRQLVDGNGLPVTDAWKQGRRDQLLELFRAVQPHAVVVELFPFGRRQMRFELLPLLDAVRSARQPALTVSSVRDVLGGGHKDPVKQDQMLAMFERYFDHVLVHGDPAVIAFNATFSHAPTIEKRLHYTGYVVESAMPAGLPREPGVPLDTSQTGVLVSAGGGAVGKRLMTTAIEARRLSHLGQQRWHMLAGINTSASELDELRQRARAEAGQDISVERHRPDFMRLLAQCRVSVSQGGYNTVMEALGTGARAVVVPFAGGAEIEQTLRAQLLARRGWIDVVEENALSPESLAQAIDRADVRVDRPSTTINMDGASRSAQLLDGWISERFA